MLEDACAGGWVNISTAHKSVGDRKMEPFELYKVVLAGGGAHIPKMREVVANAMEGKVSPPHNVKRCLNAVLSPMCVRCLVESKEDGKLS